MNTNLKTINDMVNGLKKYQNKLSKTADTSKISVYRQKINQYTIELQQSGVDINSFQTGGTELGQSVTFDSYVSGLMNQLGGMSEFDDDKEYTEPEPEPQAQAQEGGANAKLQRLQRLQSEISLKEMELNNLKRQISSMRS